MVPRPPPFWVLKITTTTDDLRESPALLNQHTITFAITGWQHSLLYCYRGSRARATGNRNPPPASPHLSLCTEDRRKQAKQA